MREAGNQISPTQQRLSIPEGDCQVSNRANLASYRVLYRKWMQWYEHSSDNPNTIEGQIMSMMFHDLTYRSLTSIRASLSPATQVSARSSTLAYIIDSGYLTNQVLAVSKLVDSRNDVVSLWRLVRDIKKNRKMITREIYVAAFGDPYDPGARREEIDQTDPAAQILGLQAPGLSRWMYSHDAHKRFDVLAGVSREQRNRENLIRPVVFDRIIEWLSLPEIKQLEQLRHNYLAHAGDALKRGERTIMQTARFRELDRAQEAIIRAERAITDCLLNYRISRDVVPMPPLGQFSGLDVPYSTREGQEWMWARWNELEKERESWKEGLLEKLIGDCPNSGSTAAK
jgi:hypothetical protein